VARDYSVGFLFFLTICRGSSPDLTGEAGIELKSDAERADGRRGVPGASGSFAGAPLCVRSIHGTI
jgi:hypothetical protein